MTNTTQNLSLTDEIQHEAQKKSHFSATTKGALIGAIAGRILPVFNTFTGAIVGGIVGKVYEKKRLTDKSV